MERSLNKLCYFQQVVGNWTLIWVEAGELSSVRHKPRVDDVDEAWDGNDDRDLIKLAR